VAQTIFFRFILRLLFEGSKSIFTLILLIKLKWWLGAELNRRHKDFQLYFEALTWVSGLFQRAENGRKQRVFEGLSVFQKSRKLSQSPAQKHALTTAGIWDTSCPSDEATSRGCRFACHAARLPAVQGSGETRHPAERFRLAIYEPAIVYSEQVRLVINSLRRGGQEHFRPWIYEPAVA
jgi:hypothetical protein